MATKATATKAKVTVGSLIDSLQKVRAEKRELAVKEKALNSEYEALQVQLIELMDKEGVTKSTGKLASASLSENTQFTVEDWDGFMAYAAKLKRFDLVQRRVSAPAIRELWEMKGAVPGLTPFVKREVSLRDL